MGKKSLVIMVAVLILVTLFIEVGLPAMAQNSSERASVPKPDVQYIKVGRVPDKADPFSGYAEVELSDSDKKLLTDYINFGGRTWKAAEGATASGNFIVEINKDQAFLFTPSTDGEIKLSVIYYCNTADGVKTFTTEISGKAAAPLLVLLQGNK